MMLNKCTTVEPMAEPRRVQFLQEAKAVTELPRQATGAGLHTVCTARW